MKLKDLPRNTWFMYYNVRVLFEHMDGMYGLCQTEGGETLHLVAWTEVEPCE